MINQAICIDGLDNHLLCPMQCCLNGAYQQSPKFLVESSSETTHAIELVDPFNAAKPLMILLQLHGMTSYFDVCSPSIAEYEDEDIPKIHLTSEEPPWDLSTDKTSDRETRMLDH